MFFPSVGGQLISLFERSEFLIATSKKIYMYVICVCVRVCSTNIGFSVEKNCACVRLILVLVWGTYYVPDTYVPHFMIPGTQIPGTYVPHFMIPGT